MVKKIEIIARNSKPEKEEFLWKYMNTQKFLSFLLNKHFYYSRLDQLEDTYEGINQRYLTALLMKDRDALSGIIDVNHPYYEKHLNPSFKASELKFVDKQKKYFVLCWITGSRESAGMWNLYSEPGGIALKIKFDQFEKFISGDNFKFDHEAKLSKLEYGMVVYRNYVDVVEVQANYFKIDNTSFRKDVSFEHEKEFRVCLTLSNSLPTDVQGIEQTINKIEDLPFEIILHPKSSAWQVENVRKLVRQFAPLIVVKNSELKLRS